MAPAYYTQWSIWTVWPDPPVALSPCVPGVGCARWTPRIGRRSCSNAVKLREIAQKFRQARPRVVWGPIITLAAGSRGPRGPRHGDRAPPWIDTCDGDRRIRTSQGGAPRATLAPCLSSRKSGLGSGGRRVSCGAWTRSASRDSSTTRKPASFAASPETKEARRSGLPRDHTGTTRARHFTAGTTRTTLMFPGIPLRSERWRTTRTNTSTEPPCGFAAHATPPDTTETPPGRQIRRR